MSINDEADWRYLFWNLELQGQDNALLASNLKGHLYFPAGLCTIIAKLESNSAPEGSDLYFSAAAECLVGEEKESGYNINLFAKFKQFTRTRHCVWTYNRDNRPDASSACSWSYFCLKTGPQAQHRLSDFDKSPSSEEQPFLTIKKLILSTETLGLLFIFF